MDIILALAFSIGCIVTTHFLTRNSLNKRIGEFKNIKEAVDSISLRKAESDIALNETLKKIEESSTQLGKLDLETKELQDLKKTSHQLRDDFFRNEASLIDINNLIEKQNSQAQESKNSLQALMGKIDLYSRLDNFVEHGHFETPEYLFETSERFSARIKVIRENQKILIQSGLAITGPNIPRITGDKVFDKRIIDGQMKLTLRTFNIECDLLIAKVAPSNFQRTLDRIEKLANDLEKLTASLRCGISNEYVTLKYEECGVQYQYTLKKKDEQEEQKLIREQMREEARIEKEYREALIAAEREEKLYRDLLEKARTELNTSSHEERAAAEARIAELERQLAEAEAKEQRAKSLAEQTRRGHVYVISNVGSFGENVYKIGMTRRLDPMDRVRELGDASVPFSFDVHAIIFTDDAPTMEAALHRKFNHHRVNAVNLRKEFFRVELEKIRDAVAEIDGENLDFKTTIVAEEYFESKRLRETKSLQPEKREAFDTV
ncbi:DUF4041 domain-containing protein [Cellvibrio polysaccharolyticus]|uniref:DUF4041 domain-containing protein n=1 Tax=Cellvibrio polysaccharolyticus TaxID=2082724 RepID=A0A928YV37_9GAMM|nr:DUF4041 domain-containing protein [Cellvibrio polysaccharolyticus]MBE8718619.1 DUF4041 domain-containing protein [Cellvibrio polysaccharolyticus]